MPICSFYTKTNTVEFRLSSYHGTLLLPDNQICRIIGYLFPLDIAQELLGYIKRQFRTRNKETILTLYNALVRPWSPSLRKDIERLEAVQARATKLIPSIRHLGYVRRLERLNLYSLEKRRLRGQLIETFKMLKGVNNIDYRHLFTFSNNRTRSYGWKLELKRFNTSQCGNFFTYKIAPIWNRLPAEAVNSASVEQFKIELDKVIDTLI